MDSQRWIYSEQPYRHSIVGMSKLFVTLLSFANSNVHIALSHVSLLLVMSVKIALGCSIVTFPKGRMDDLTESSHQYLQGVGRNLHTKLP